MVPRFFKAHILQGTSFFFTCSGHYFILCSKLFEMLIEAWYQRRNSTLFLFFSGENLKDSGLDFQSHLASLA